MPLTFEQFQKLRDEGFNAEQIASFEKRRSLTSGLEKAEAIKGPEPFFKRALPSIGQFTGGIAGFAGGAQVGKPYLGSAIGGTLGRGAGILGARWPESVKEKPIRALEATIPGLPFVQEYRRMSPELKQRFKKHIGTTAITEAVGAGAGKAISKVTGFLGNKVMEGLLGARVAQRGEEVGYSKILNKEFFKKRIPQQIAVKMDKFFNKLSNVTGQGVEEVINSPKYKNMNVVTRELKDNVNKIIPEGTTYKNIFGYLDDLAFKSNAEKNLVVNETKRIMSMGGRVRKLPTLWQTRRDLDKVITSRNWGDDAIDYLTKLRRVLNDPIRNAGDDVAFAFNKYRFVKEGEHDLAKKFTATYGPTGEIYAPAQENLADTLLKTNKDELIRRLKDLDALANADDKVIEDFLNYAAAEGLEKGIGLGVWQEIMTSFFGGRKGLAYIGKIAQQTKPLRQGIGRAAVVGMTEQSNQE